MLFIFFYILIGQILLVIAASIAIKLLFSYRNKGALSRLIPIACVALAAGHILGYAGLYLLKTRFDNGALWLVTFPLVITGVTLAAYSFIKIYKSPVNNPE